MNITLSNLVYIDRYTPEINRSRDIPRLYSEGVAEVMKGNTVKNRIFLWFIALGDSLLICMV